MKNRNINLEYPDDGLINVDGKAYLSLDTLELWITNLVSAIKNEDFDTDDKEALYEYALYSIKESVIKLQIYIEEESQLLRPKERSLIRKFLQGY